MSQLSCYNWLCWCATAPTRLNSPGISKMQPISALQPLFKMHCSQGNTRRNKIKREFAVTVSAVHCEMPEGKKKTHKKPKTFHMVFILIKCFSPLFSQRHSECWLIRHWRTQYDFAISHAICKTELATPFCRENMLWQNRVIYLLHFVFKLCKALSYHFSWWKLKGF